MTFITVPRALLEDTLKALIQYQEHEEQEYGYHLKMAEIDALGGTPPAVAAIRAALAKTAMHENVMRTALENIAGIRPIVDNLLSDKDIARIALSRVPP